MNTDIKERITITRLKLISRYPFFGYLLMQSGIYENNQIPTACTDGSNIYFNSEFFDSLSEKELEFVLCHEVLHLVLSHITRKGSRHVIRWNIAIDFATNEILHASNVGEAPPHTLYDLQFKGMCAEEIYDKIQVEEISICSCSSGGGSKKGKKKSKGSPSSDGENSKQSSICPKCGGQGFDSHDYESIKGKEQEQEGRWKGILETAAHKAKQKGNLPGELEYIVNEILQPKIPWQTLLQRYLASRSKADFKWIPPNKRYIWQGIYLPRVHYDPSLKAVIVLDSSGSISDQELNEFVTEVISMMRCGFDYTLWILTCDAAIQTTQKMTKNQGYVPIQIKGRGGCLGEGAEVLTAKGYTTIENIKEGDEVFAHDGQIRKVLETYVNKNDIRPCFKMNTMLGQEIILTDEHPLYVMSPQTCKFSRGGICIPGKNSKYCNTCDNPVEPKFIGWKSAGEIYREKSLYGWYSVIPNFKGGEGTFDEGYLEGWFIGDGRCGKTHESMKIEFLHNPKDGVPKKLESLLSQYGTTNIRYHKKNKTINLRVYNKSFGNYLRHLKYEKGLFGRIRSANSEYCKGFIQGMLESDGCIKVKGGGSIQQSNKYFIDCITYACYKAGYVASINSHMQPKNGFGKIKKLAYVAHISNPEIRGSRSYLGKDKKLYVKIQKIEPIKNPGTTYNIKVAETESYMLKHIGSHNTSFVPPFKWVEKERIDADVLIYFTDLCGDFPDKAPNYPVIWIATTDEKVPFGTIFRYNKEIK